MAGIRIIGSYLSPCVRKVLACLDLKRLDYLESQLPGAGFLFGTRGIADISIASFLRNAALARFTVDVERWPATARYVDRVLGEDCMAKLQPFEVVMLRTRISEQRAALAAAGAPLSADTVGGEVPRRGVLRLL